MLKASVSGPSAILFGNELHVISVDTDYCLQENVFVSGPNQWLPFRLTGPGGLLPLAPNAAPFSSPVVAVSGAMLHVCYRDDKGYFQDLIRFNGAWFLQPITGAGGAAGAPTSFHDAQIFFVNGCFNCAFSGSDGELWGVGNPGTGLFAKQITYAGCTTKDASTGSANCAYNPSVIVRDAIVSIVFRNRFHGVGAYLSTEYSRLYVATAPFGATNWTISEVTATSAPPTTGAFSSMQCFPKGDPVTLPDSNFAPPNGVSGGPLIVYRDADGGLRRLLFAPAALYRRAWDGLQLNRGAFGSATAAPAVASDPFVVNGLGNWTLVYYLDASGNIVVVTANNYSPTLSGTELFLRCLALGVVVLSRSQVAPKPYPTSFTADPAGPNSGAAVCYQTLIGPGGVLNMLPAAAERPCVVPVGTQDLHLFYRGTDQQIYCVLTHFDGNVASTLCTVV